MSRSGIGGLGRCWLWVCVLLVAFGMRGLCSSSVGSGSSPSPMYVSGASWDRWDGCVRLRFWKDLEFEPSNLSPFIEIDPPLSNMRVYHRSWYRDCLDIEGDWVSEKTYKICVKSGLRSRQGECLLRDRCFRVKVPRKRPAISLLHSGMFYPLSRGEYLFPLRLRNVSELTVEAMELDRENLIPYDLSSCEMTDMSHFLGKKTYSVSSSDNQSEEFLLDLSGLLPVGKPGLYLVRSSGQDKKRGGTGQRCTLSETFFVVTDLGLAVCHDAVGRELVVSVRRLSDNRAVSGATVSVYSQKNARIATGKSDGQGLFRFRYDSRYEDGNRPRLAMVESGEDCSFLELLRHPSSDWGAPPVDCPESVRGALVPGAQAFVYWERGAVRPGECAHVSAFLRRREERGIPVLGDYPCVLRLRDPQGREVSKVKVRTDSQGYVSHEFVFAQGSATGRYTVECGIDGGRVLGQASVLVALYVPDRLRVDLETDKKVVRPGESFTATCRARYYYGAPALQARGSLQSHAGERYFPPHWKGYSVGGLKDVSGDLERVRVPFESLGQRQQMTLMIPSDYRSSTPQAMAVSATVLEAGGRGVTSHRAVLVDSCGWYLGLKSGETDGSHDIVLDYRVLGLSAKEEMKVPVGTKAVVSLKQIRWDYVQVKTEGSYELKWVCERLPVGQALTVDLSASQGRIRIPHVPEGHYEVEVRAGAGRGTVIECWHYYGEGGRRSADPNRLTFTTDRSDYLPGETATVSFEAMGNGYGLIAYGESGLQEVLTMAVRDGKNSFQVPIPSWLPSERFSACVTVVTGTEPHCRVFGQLALRVRQDAHRLCVGLSAPEVSRPEQDLEIGVSLRDPSGRPVSGMAQVFLVDSGVLSLTSYRTPDIFGAFFSGRACRLLCTDIYDKLYPELKLAGSRRIGGDGVFGMLRQKFGDITHERTAVVYLRPVSVGGDGKAVVKVRLPRLLGSMRIMCVASSADRVGSGEREVIVRDRLGVQGSCPRAVVPGDEFECVFTLNNFSLEKGPYEFSIQVPAELKALGATSFRGELTRGVPVTHVLRCRGTERLGAASLTGRLRMGASEASDTVRLSLRSMNPPISTSESRLVRSGSEAVFSLTSQDWLSGTCKGEFSVSSVPVTGIGDGLAWLNAYPYGCLEQTVACVLPLLNLDQLVAMKVVHRDEISGYEGKLEAFTARIRTMYLGRGAFALWPGSREANEEASLFAANFLFELHRQKPQDPELIRSIRRLFLEDMVERCGVYPASMRAYACYVLSLLDQSEVNGDSTGTVAALNLIADGEVSFSSLLACAALIKAGHASEAMPLFRRCLASEVWGNVGEPYAYSDLNSRLGKTLKLVMDILPDDPVAGKLAYRLNQNLRKDGLGWGTTQANAWATYALSSFVAHQGTDQASGTVSLGGGKTVSLGQGGVSRWAMKEGDVFKVRNTGKKSLFVTCRRSGISRAPMSSIDGALSIKRTYLDLYGKPVSSVRQGDLLQVRLEIEALCNVSELVVVDLLPGGLEIEDSRLVTRARAVNAQDQSKEHGALKVRFVEGRDDRLLLFGDLWPRGKGTYTYQVRAVSRGQYGIPPVTVEAMYAPDLRAVGVSAVRLEVK